MRHALVACSLAAVSLWSPAVFADQGLFAQLDGTASLLSDTPQRSFFAPGLGYNLRAGWRGDRVGVFAQVGQATWVATSLDASFVPGVLNAGVGGELHTFDGRVSSSLAVGSSTLLFDSALDSAGTTGWFANLRPFGLRWGLSESLALQLWPITFQLMQPVVAKPSRLTRVEYQTVLALEFR